MNDVVPTFMDFFCHLKEVVSSFDDHVIADRSKDIKVGLDLKLNREIGDFLVSVSGYDILSEEDEMRKNFGDYEGYYWIVDPLDGSLNKIRGIPLFCTSIALWKESNPVMGVIFDYSRDELFIGVVSDVEFCRARRGAYRNGEVIGVSGVESVAQGVITTGFPSLRSYGADELLKFVDKVKRWKKVRLIGSAALSLAWVACGRCDAYIEEDIRVWDVAAGLALVKAAGGEIYLKGNPDRENFVTAVATNGKIRVEDVL